MFVIQGIERHGNIYMEFFFKDKKNILKNVVEMANYSSVERVVVREIIIDEDDEDMSKTILMTEAFYYKK